VQNSNSTFQNTGEAFRNARRMQAKASAQISMAMVTASQ
jgi:hypothetical protein